MKYKDAIRKRRSIYDLKKDIEITEDELIEIIEHNLRYTPSAFNSQSQRVVVLLNKHHEAFWNVTKAALKAIVAPENFRKTADKIEGFKAGYGTILYFDDTEVTNTSIEKFMMYEKNVLNWSEQQNGMLQSNIWSALAEQNIGASLQHYNELIEEKAAEMFDIPTTWRLIAEMPFGGIKTIPDTKKSIDLDQRLLIRK